MFRREHWAGGRVPTRLLSMTRFGFQVDEGPKHIDITSHRGDLAHVSSHQGSDKRLSDALASMSGLGVYNASKAAAWSATQSLRADLGKQGTKVFNVFPGAVDTDMFRGIDIQDGSR